MATLDRRKTYSATINIGPKKKKKANRGAEAANTGRIYSARGFRVEKVVPPYPRRRQQPAAARRLQQVTPASPAVPAGGDTGFRFYEHPGMNEKEVARINKKKAAEAARKREAKRRMMQEWAGISPKLTATQMSAKQAKYLKDTGYHTPAERNRAMALQLAAYRQRRDVGATQ